MLIFDIPLYEGLPQGFLIMFMMIGAALGSFFNVLVIRWPQHQMAKNDQEAATWQALRKKDNKQLKLANQAEIPTLMGGRSKCPCCNTPIPIYWNIPIFSWLILRGTSRCCQKPIKFQYLGYELFGALLFGAIGLTVGASMYGLVLGVFLMILSLAALVDLKEGFIPDTVLFAGYIVAMILATGPHWTDMPGAFQTGLIAFFGLYLPFRLYAAIRGQAGIGCADMHLIAICGLFLGHKLIWIVFPLISLLVVTWYVFHKQWLPRGLFVQIVGAKGIPAGPAIVAATYVITAMVISGHL
jgi:prepilin signal peptidase PulO-like enzyme (type II secretory pathway)